jgi:PTS system N-acetylglucosamine-specific IIC component
MKRRHNLLGNLQKLSKAFMVTIAVLPAAALLKRLGAPDLLNIPWLFAAGDVLFINNNLALLFAVGIAAGMAEDNSGTAGLAAAAGYLVMTQVALAFDRTINTGVLAGLLVGLLSAFLYNRYQTVRLPAFLGFFGGKRFIPIITSFCCLILGVLAGLLWPLIQHGINAFGNAIAGSGSIGGFWFGFSNRLLIPFGLHYFLHAIVWFQFGQYQTPAGQIVSGDMARFFAGDPTAGTFMTGFFPVMMFGLPAACLAMIKCARKQNRKAVGGMLISVAFTSFFTGITEPVEFLFAFLSPLLYLVHALLTGISLALTSMLGMRCGFGFSAGAIDYLLNFGISSKPWELLGFGLVYGLVYYFVFIFFITRFNLPTPGRLDEEESANLAGLPPGQLKAKCADLLEAMGSRANIAALDACVTRIRLTVKDGRRVDEARLVELGAVSVLKLSGTDYQIVIGTMADPVVSHIKALLRQGG